MHDRVRLPQVSGRQSKSAKTKGFECAHELVGVLLISHHPDVMSDE